MYCSTAEMKLMDEYARAEQQKLELIKNPPKKQIKSKTSFLSQRSFLFKFMFCLVPIFLLSVMYISLNARSDVLSRDIDSLKSNIQCEESEKIRIQQQLNTQFSPKVIDSFAAKKGMSKIQPHQITRLDMSKEDRVIYCKANQSESNISLNDIFEEFKKSITSSFSE